MGRKVWKLGMDTRTTSASRASRRSLTNESDVTTTKKKAKRRRLESMEELRSSFLAEEARRLSLMRADWLQGSREEVEIFCRHIEASASYKNHYKDPRTGFRVLTTWGHFLRGNCCGNACRHCIYGHRAVPVEKRDSMRFNSVFWHPKQ